jgi:hypothetical protein
LREDSGAIGAGAKKHRRTVDGVRPGVSRQERQSVGKALVQLSLQAAVIGTDCVLRLK